MVNCKMHKLNILVHVFHDHFHTQIKLDVVWQQLCVFSLLRIFYIAIQLHYHNFKGSNQMQL